MREQPEDLGILPQLGGLEDPADEPEGVGLKGSDAEVLQQGGPRMVVVDPVQVFQDAGAGRLAQVERLAEAGDLFEPLELHDGHLAGPADEAIELGEDPLPDDRQRVCLGVLEVRSEPIEDRRGRPVADRLGQRAR